MGKYDGWQGWGHWLSTGNVNTKSFLPFGEALLMARSLRLVSEKEWRAWSKSGVRPANVPSRPDQVYVHKGWLGYEHWLWHPNPDPAQPTHKRVASGDAGSAGMKRRKKQRR